MVYDRVSLVNADVIVYCLFVIVYRMSLFTVCLLLFTECRCLLFVCCCLQNAGGEDAFGGTVYADEGSELPNGSVVRSIDVTIEIQKVAGRTLGFSIAGGRGSTPAYEDVDDVRVGGGEGGEGGVSSIMVGVLCLCRVST